MTAPLLEVAEVNFRYADRTVLCDVSFALETGSCTALAGPNGAGKTTLLRLLAGTLQPSSGKILLDGVQASSLPRKELARRVALVPQQLDIPFDYTVQQIVAQGRTPYLGLLRGMADADRAAVERALTLADVSSLRDRVFNELSGGERQRVKIALGLAQEPRLLLLDEPTQNLDVGRQAELIDTLHQLRAEGITIFASMHDLHLVYDNFSTVHLLPSGQPLVSGSPDQVLTPANLLSAFACAPGRHPLLTQTPRVKEAV